MIKVISKNYKYKLATTMLLFLFLLPLITYSQHPLLQNKSFIGSSYISVKNKLKQSGYIIEESYGPVIGSPDKTKYRVIAFNEPDCNFAFYFTDNNSCFVYVVLFPRLPYQEVVKYIPNGYKKKDIIWYQNEESDLMLDHKENINSWLITIASRY